MRSERLDELVEEALALQREPDTAHVPRRLVERAAALTGARYAAISGPGAADWIGVVSHGVACADRDRIGPPPIGRGLLGLVATGDAPVRIDDLRRDPRFTGFPPNHPEMRSFLGVPVRLGGRRYWSLYLADPVSGASFTDADERLVLTLGTFAAAAIGGAELARGHADALATSVALAAAREVGATRQEFLRRIIGAQDEERARVRETRAIRSDRRSRRYSRPSSS